MTNKVSRRRTAVWFWLLAGAGVTAMVGITGAVLMITPSDHAPQAEFAVQPADPATSPSLEAHSASPAMQFVPSNSPKANASQNAVLPTAQTAAEIKPHTPIGVVAWVQPAQPAPAGTGTGTGIGTDAAQQNYVVAPTTVAPTPLPTPPAPRLVETRRPALAQNTAQTVPARAQTESKPASQDVDTVVVTAPTNQQMAFSIDTVGRGNSLVIQLPRPKRNQ